MIPEVIEVEIIETLNEIYTPFGVECLGYRSTLDRLTYVNVEVGAASYEIKA